MTDLEKTSLFIDCNKCLEEYMMKLELEGKAPRFWLLDKFWRMKRLYEARPYLLKLINLIGSKSFKGLMITILFGVGSPILLFAHIMFRNMPIFSTITLVLSLSLSVASILASFIVTDYELVSTQIALAENWKDMKSRLGLSSVTIDGTTILF